MKKSIHASAIISQLFQVITLAKCISTILELNWNQGFKDNKTKLNICHHMPSPPQNCKTGDFKSWKEQERLFEMSKNEKCTCKACKTVFHCQISQFVALLLPSSSWLLKLPIDTEEATKGEFLDPLRDVSF